MAIGANLTKREQMLISAIVLTMTAQNERRRQHHGHRESGYGQLWSSYNWAQS